MPPKKAAQEQLDAPPPVDPVVKDSEALGDYFGELRDASAKGAVADLVAPAAGRKWQLAVTRAVEEGATNAAAAGPEEYADWVRRFGFSVEREIQLREAETLKMKTQTTKNARHLAHLRAAEKQQVTEDNAATAAKLPMAGPLPERPPLFPYAVARDQVDTITSMQLKPGAGDAFELTRNASYDDVDFHALVNVGACHAQAVGSRPQDEASANLTLDQVVSALVQPYQTSTWRLSAFDAAHFKVRAIARWIAAFVRVVPPPLGPPPAGGSGAGAAPVPAPPAAGRGKADGPSVSISAPGGKPGAASATTWTPYRVEDDDEDADGQNLPELVDGREGATSGEDARGFATAHAVFQTRVGDPHQIAVLFAFMCRLPAAGIVFATHRGADAAVAGNLRIETDAAPTSYSALRSGRPSVAVPSGVAAAYVEGRLHPTPGETLSTAVGGAQPCRVRVVRGTLKGSVDAHGKPLGYLPWSWNAVTLPDGKQYLLDVSLCAANVPVKFLLQHHLSCLAVSSGEMSATAGAEGAAPAAGSKDKAAKDKAAASAAPPPTGASSIESVAAALTACFGNYNPVSGHLQFHRHAELQRVAAALSQPHSDAAREAMAVTPTAGTRGYHNATLLVQSGTGVTPAIACTAVACAKAGLPHSHAQGQWAEVQPAGAQGPLGLGQLASMMSRTCFEPSYFLADPRHFATLHYPDDQAMLLLAPAASADTPGNAGGASTQEGASSHHHRRHGARLVTKAQWETYPRLTHTAANTGFALESHARRGNFTAKGCPVYMSFVLGDAPHTELQVTVFRGGLQGVLNSQVTVAPAAPAEGMSPEAYAQQADLQLAAALRQVQAGYQVICHAPGSAAAAAASGGAAAAATTTPAAPATTGTGGVAQPSLSVVDPTYYALSREERNRRSVLSLMLPDVGLYSVCVGARMLDRDGRPLSSVFSLMTAYQMNVSFVPTNEPLMPRIREPATVAKIVAPATSRVAGGQTYFAIAPTLPKVIAAVVVNDVAAVTIKPKKDPLGNSGSMGTSSRPGADGTVGVSGGADGAAPKPLHKEAFTRVFFLPWDSNTATFNGTCAIEPGTVTIWLGLRHEAVHDDPLASMVPPHLLPSATSASTAQLLAHMLAEPSAALGGVPLPPGTAAESQRPETAATESSGGGIAGPPLPKTAFEVLQAIQAASKPPPGAPTPQPLTGSSLAAAWKPASSQPEETTETAKPAKGKGKAKPSAAAAAPLPPPPVVKPPPAAVFVPFVTNVSAVRRIPSKDAGLLTNGYSIGAQEPPADIDSYVPPKSLLYMPPTTGSEQRVTHGILAKTVDAETVDIVAKQREAVGGVFVGKERPISM